MLRQLLTISKNTFTESIRQPIFAVLVLVGTIALILNLQLAAYTLEADTKLMVDMGLSTILLISLFLAAVTATGVLTDEIEKKTVLTVISKPINRPTFVVGKYLGVSAAILLAYYILAMIFFLCVRHGVMQTASNRVDWPVVIFGFGGALLAVLFASYANYMFRWVFTSTLTWTLAITETIAFVLVLFISKKFAFQMPYHDLFEGKVQLMQVIVGVGLITFAVLILTSIALAASTRLGKVMTTLICIGAFMLGLISNSLNQWTNSKLEIPAHVGVFESFSNIFSAHIPFYSQLIYAASKLIYLITPNLQFLWPADAITQGNPFTPLAFAASSLYAVFYIIAILSIAVILFQKREVG
ncbi:hypothetical protein [Poriferisphaera sp. WC338]|uniref:hypothetical protein n=1 Tax=Poriferisphaera sp. WC338 TaxID=3425129 RepID=UPI003D8198FB